MRLYDYKIIFALFILMLGNIPSVSAISSSKLGEQIYSETCITCHGDDGKGALDGVPDLKTRLSQKDVVLIQSITKGLEKSNAALSMPAKGGDEEISPRGVKSVLTYMRQKFGQGKNRYPIR